MRNLVAATTRECQTIAVEGDNGIFFNHIEAKNGIKRERFDVRRKDDEDNDLPKKVVSRGYGSERKTGSKLC